jgi:hypothetical protein
MVPSQAYYIFPRACHTFFSVYYIFPPTHALSFNLCGNINRKAQHFKTSITFNRIRASHCDYNQQQLKMNAQNLCKIINLLYV